MAKKGSDKGEAASAGNAGNAASSADTADALIAVGQKAPAFKLANQKGEIAQLKDFKGSWVVLYFYPKDDTPGCTTEACDFRDGIGQFTDRQVVVLGISPDDEESHGKFAVKHKLPFDLLADTEQVVCKAYGVWQEKSMYGRTYMGVVRTTYLIDPQGKVAARWDKVKVKGHVRQVLDEMERMQE